jgi:hypothetical protein
MLRCLLLIFTACDTLTEDAQPVQRFEDLNLVALPNSSAVVNLSGAGRMQPRAE